MAPLAHFGRTATLNAATYCVSVSSISPGQRKNELVADASADLYGSEGWRVRVPARSTRLRPTRTRAGRGPGYGYGYGYGYGSGMSPQEGPHGQSPEVDPEDLRQHGDKAVRLAHDLAPSESARWADLVNTAASMAEIEDPGQ
jgi:hypothetical protein